MPSSTRPSITRPSIDRFSPLRKILTACAVLGLLFGAAIGVGWWALRASLPQLDGRFETAAAGPRADVLIERDADGAPTVRGESLADVAWGTGFLHAQDRFFQMDLARRMAAGELSALFGERALERDKAVRVFRLRRVARQAIADATPAQRAWLEAYSHGVNAGLEALAVRPWEYLLLRVTPLRWEPEDSILVVHSMWLGLQFDALREEISRREIALRVEQRIANASRDEADASRAIEVLRFLYPRGDEWDAPNFATLAETAAANGGEAFRSPQVPPPELFDLRGGGAATARRAAPAPQSLEEATLPGSNAWAVAAAHAGDGGALVAGDMHLGLRVPATWYRARLSIAAVADAPLELNGVTLPGLPAIVAGSNGHVAWSFTNSYGDWADVSPVTCELARNRYRTAEGEGEFRIIREIIEVAGGEAHDLQIRDSPFGVLVRVDASAGSTAMTGETCWLARWLVTEPGATNLAALELQQVRDIDAALALAPAVGIPHQNFTVADRNGRIGWTIIGRIPQGELGPQTSRPIRWREAGEVPVIRDPEVGRLWSANARHVEGPMEYLIGNDEADGGMHYDKGARQRQIRDALLALARPATPADMLNIQLDDRALLLAPWQRLLLGVLDEEAVRNQPKRAELRRWVSDWQGRASIDSVSYRLVRDFRDRTRNAVWTMITDSLGTGASRPFPLFEGSLWRLVTEQPPHMLSDRYADWRSLLLQQADAVIDAAEKSCGELARCTWGARNMTAIRHPLSSSLGPLAKLIDMSVRPLDGDLHVPRVAGPEFGASERFAVSPGREAEGYLQIPGGQSGHPLSPFYRAGYEDWVEGRPRPLLPGRTMHTLTISSGRSSPATSQVSSP